MKKAPLIVIVVLAVLFAFSPLALADNLEVVISPQSVYVDGAQVAFEIYNINGNNYFKLRDLAYILNGTKSQFSVDFDNTANMISLVTGRAYRAIGNEMIIGADKSATAVKSSQSLMIDGEEKSLLAYNLSGNNFFQLRALGDAVGFDVEYDPLTNRVMIGSLVYPSDAHKLYPPANSAYIYAEVDGALYMLREHTGGGELSPAAIEQCIYDVDGYEDEIYILGGKFNDYFWSLILENYTRENIDYYPNIDGILTFPLDNYSGMSYAKVESYVNGTEPIDIWTYTYRNKSISLPGDFSGGKTLVNGVRVYGMAPPGAEKMETYINVADLCEYFGINVAVRIAYFEYQRCYILVIDH